MPHSLRFRLVNVFCPQGGNKLLGNQLCVFEDGTGLTGDEMQALALQFNLSETTFLFPPTDTVRASKRVRIFTPGTELPFAGHPTLGSSFVVHSMHGSCFTLEMDAGFIPVETTGGDVWKLTANQAVFRAEPNLTGIAAMVHLSDSDFVSEDIPATHVNAGIEQLMVQVASVESLMRANCTRDSMAALNNCQGVLLFVLDKVNHSITSRFFFRDSAAAFEDPGTGSACANLGRLLQREGLRGDFTLEQGHVLKRLCKIGIAVGDENVQVSGRVVQVGSGVIEI
ncbi:hypothetical protein BC830DRAFT_1141239 [Chytriomyces sp. MP71]|nr:hypothetical protein BC830DRAFT_1141239 [Chytriomyces sp. MP71]